MGGFVAESWGFGAVSSPSFSKEGSGEVDFYLRLNIKDLPLVVPLNEVAPVGYKGGQVRGLDIWVFYECRSNAKITA